MFTDCPACGRQFHVRAEHLAPAKGEVRCGFCGHRFNALERLRDTPLPLATAAEPQTPEPQFEIPEPPSPPPPSGVPGPVPAVLEEDRPPPRSRMSRVLWSLGVLVLLLAGAVQAAWFNRDRVLARYPELRPWVERICAELDCEVIRYRDASKFELVNRDVRLHPRYENSLLVNATMRNGAGYPQPFPGLQLVLFDTDGRVMAHRNFTPAEYLDQSIDASAGIAPDAPIHFVLEVTGATEGAVSFEFGFL